MASVKPDDMSAPRMYRAECQGGPGARFKDYFYCTDATAATMVMAAFGLQQYELSGAPQDSGPRYEVRAVIPKKATREQIRIMLQNLLKERFHFAYHFEKREMPVSKLVKIGNGTRLRPASTDELPPEESGGAATGKKTSGPPPLSRGNSSLGITVTGVLSLEGNGVPLSELIANLSHRLERKVTDETGTDWEDSNTGLPTKTISRGTSESRPNATRGLLPGWNSTRRISPQP